jgi:hypothetical protein
MIPASQRLYEAIIERRIVHPDQVELNAHVAATVARHGRRGWRVDKANRSTRSTPWSPWRWRLIGSRTGPSRPGSWAGCEEILRALRGSRRRLLLRRHRPRRPRGRQLAKLRTRVFAAKGRRCRDCGRSEVPFEVHHVNGDRATTGSPT